jgi:hypothetical protein
MIPLLYSNNADIRYPLSDFHDTDVPNDALLDLSLGIPPGVTPALCTLRISKGFVFVSFEDTNTREPIASVLVTNPRAARIYPLDMHMEGYGWVVFGPRVTQTAPYYSGDINILLDPQCVLSLEQAAPFRIEVNGEELPVDTFLEILTLSDMLTLTREGNRIYIDRNDEVLSIEDRRALQVQVEDNMAPLFTLDGVLPDARGNIDVVVIGCIEGCKDVWSLKVPRGDIGEGVAGELPLDIFEKREYVEGDPCAPSEAAESSGSNAEEPDPFFGCKDIVRVPILDPTTGLPIGTLYTV